MSAVPNYAKFPTGRLQQEERILSAIADAYARLVISGTELDEWERPLGQIRRLEAVRRELSHRNPA